MEYSGAGVKLIYDKNQKQKISWHCPFNPTFILFTSFRYLVNIHPILHFFLSVKW